MKGKKKKKRPGETASLLTRLMKGRPAAKGSPRPKKQGNGTANVSRVESATEESTKPKTPLDRSISEIKNMMAVGENDPERLAMLLSKLLGSEQKRKQEEKEAFDKMVLDIVDRDKQAGASN